MGHANAVWSLQWHAMYWQLQLSDVCHYTLFVKVILENAGHFMAWVEGSKIHSPLYQLWAMCEMWDTQILWYNKINWCQIFLSSYVRQYELWDSTCFV